MPTRAGYERSISTLKSDRAKGVKMMNRRRGVGRCTYHGTRRRFSVQARLRGSENLISALISSFERPFFYFHIYVFDYLSMLKPPGLRTFEEICYHIRLSRVLLYHDSQFTESRLIFLCFLLMIRRSFFVALLQLVIPRLSNATCSYLQIAVHN